MANTILMGAVGGLGEGMVQHAGRMEEDETRQKDQAIWEIRQQRLQGMRQATDKNLYDMKREGMEEDRELARQWSPVEGAGGNILQSGTGETMNISPKKPAASKGFGLEEMGGVFYRMNKDTGQMEPVGLNDELMSQVESSARTSAESEAGNKEKWHKFDSTVFKEYGGKDAFIESEYQKKKQELLSGYGIGAGGAQSWEAMAGGPAKGPAGGKSTADDTKAGKGPVTSLMRDEAARATQSREAYEQFIRDHNPDAPEEEIKGAVESKFGKEIVDTPPTGTNQTSTPTNFDELYDQVQGIRNINPNVAKDYLSQLKEIAKNGKGVNTIKYGKINNKLQSAIGIHSPGYRSLRTDQQRKAWITRNLSVMDNKRAAEARKELARIKKTGK